MLDVSSVKLSASSLCVFVSEAAEVRVLIESVVKFNPPSVVDDVLEVSSEAVNVVLLAESSVKSSAAAFTASADSEVVEVSSLLSSSVTNAVALASAGFVIATSFGKSSLSSHTFTLFSSGAFSCRAGTNNAWTPVSKSPTHQFPLVPI